MKITKRVVCLLLVAIMVFTSSSLITLADELPLPGETPIEDPIPNEEPLDGNEVDPEDNNNNEDGDSKDLPDDESDEEADKETDIEEEDGDSEEEAEEDEEEIEEILLSYKAAPFDWSGYPTTLDPIKATLVSPNPDYGTKIKNGDFSYHPQIGPDKSEYSGSKKNASGHSSDNWQTTQPTGGRSSGEHFGVQNSRFEWVNNYLSGSTTYISSNNPLDGGPAAYAYSLRAYSAGDPRIKNSTVQQSYLGPNVVVDPFVELNCNEPGTLYQDLGTNGKDVIIWSLNHASRYHAGDPQKMKVVIGDAKDKPEPTVDKAPGHESKGWNASDLEVIVNYNVGSYTEYQNGSIKDYDSSDVLVNAISKKGFAREAGGDAYDSIKYLSMPEVSSVSDNWKKVEGVYIVPEGQTLTRFAFQSINPGSSGNFLDDVEFKTLVGKLEIRQDPSKPTQLIVEGYYGGDPNKDPKIVYDYTDKDGNHHIGEIDMSDIPKGGGDFIAYIPIPSPDFDKVGVHVDGYPDDAGPSIKGSDAVTNKPNYTISFVTNTVNGVNPSFTPAQQTVPWGNSGTRPTEDIVDNNGYYNINKDGAGQVNWYYYVDGNPLNKDPANRLLYDFTQPVNSNITVYAEWDGDEPLFTVTYDPDNGQEPWLHGGIPYDGKTSTDITPTRDGKVFDGWDYYDESGNRVPFDFNTPIRRNYILIARYVNPPSNAPSPGIVIPTTAKRMAKTEESEFNIGYILLIIALVSIALLATPKRRKR